MLDGLKSKLGYRKKDSKTEIKFHFSVGVSFYTVLIMALAYFIYPQWQGVFGIVIFSAVMSLTLIFACIPFVGIAVQIIVYYYWLAPAALAFTGIWHTWLTLILWGMAFIIGIALWVIVTLVILVAVFRD